MIPKTLFFIFGVKYKMPLIATKLPRKEILEVYEKRKLEFTKKLNEEIQKQIEAETETQKKVKKAKSCEICGHTSYRYRMNSQDCVCRNGHITMVDPFI